MLARLAKSPSNCPQESVRVTIFFLLVVAISVRWISGSTLSNEPKHRPEVAVDAVRDVVAVLI